MLAVIAGPVPFQALRRAKRQTAAAAEPRPTPKRLAAFVAPIYVHLPARLLACRCPLLGNRNSKRGPDTDAADAGFSDPGLRNQCRHKKFHPSQVVTMGTDVDTHRYICNDLVGVWRGSKPLVGGAYPTVTRP